MNPQDMFLSSAPPTAFQPPAQQAYTPVASTSHSRTNGAPDVSMGDLEEEEAPEKPKTKVELEKEKKDLELAELLERMEEWKPVVSPQSSTA
jgi:hypothetical protein